ncbi:unnamed protein product [Closterium sp. NIES-64]|nr:unnamed protein product [Closterium sp. NIES-64]
MVAKRPAYDGVGRSTAAATALPFLLLLLLPATANAAAARPSISALFDATGPAARRVGGAGRAENLARRALQDYSDYEPWVEPPEECHEEQGNLNCPSGGGCMHESQVCDGKPHCSDGSDESPDFCREFDCEIVRKVSCPTLTGCMPPGSVCNGVADCADGSDEGRQCRQGYQDDSYYCADQGLEQCPSDRYACLRQEDYCDGYETCYGYDEANCEKHVCSFGMIQCPKTFYCAWGTLCDGVQDCVMTAEAEDEDKAFCSGYSCPEGFKKCADGLQCVAEGLFCDGTRQRQWGFNWSSGGTVVLSAEEVARQRKEAAARRAAAVAAKKRAAAAKHAAVEARRAKQAAKAAAIAEKKKKQEEKAAAVAEKKRLQEAKAVAIAEKKRKQEEKAAAIAEKKKKQEEKAAAIAEKKRKQAEKAAAIEAKKKKQAEKAAALEARKEREAARAAAATK